MRKAAHPYILTLLFTAITAFGTVCAWAEDAVVYVRSSGFSPVSVNIGFGETVYFIVADENGPYCIQSTTGAWTPWYLFEEGDGFGITFNEAGDYYYRDIFTYNTGVIHVGSTPPNITLSSAGIVAGQFQFQVGGLTLGKQAVLESSTSLGVTANWVALQTNTVNSATVSFSQPATPGRHFFRVVQLP